MATTHEQLEQAQAQLVQLRAELASARENPVTNQIAAVYRQPKIGAFKHQDPAK